MATAVNDTTAPSTTTLRSSLGATVEKRADSPDQQGLAQYLSSEANPRQASGKPMRA